jgi:hypothetical protein
MTYVTDICLNETERRGELTISNGVPVVPYECEYGVETILTRADAIGRKAKVRLNRVEKMNKRKKYRVAKVYYKTDKGEDGVIHSDSNGKTPFQWVSWAFAEAERQGKEFYRMGGYFEEIWVVLSRI